MKIILTLFILLSVFTAQAKPLNQIEWQPPKGMVALTFDDGPNPIYTPQILDILKKNNVHATFFVMGWAAKKYPELIKRMVREGHAVGHHTNSHPNLRRIHSPKRLYKEIVWPKLVIKNIIGKPPVCIRPPFGMGNERIRRYMAKHGMYMVPLGWNSFDYNRPGAMKIVKQVVDHARSRRVYLLHDGPKWREQTVEALPYIIKGIRKKGYGFAPICMP